MAHMRSIIGTASLGAITGVAIACGPVAPGTNSVLKDCADCPQMVVIPPGEFVMGSPSSELYRGAEAQHRVTVPPFALSKYEVTFAEWDACVADGGCGGFTPDDQGWGRANRPVIGVSWDDAQSYLEWLNRKTGEKYRLPSESEWEYAARAGTTTPFAFGATITTSQANFDGSTGYGDAPKGANRQQTTPAGTFPANAFGLHDMHGNVWEWVEDCWSDEYTDTTPTDGRPFLAPNCNGRVMRGGSWEDYPGDVRAAARVGSGHDEQSWSDGFRVARAVR